MRNVLLPLVFVAWLPALALCQDHAFFGRPELPEDAWEVKQYKRIFDQNNKRNPGGTDNMDWERWKQFMAIGNHALKTSSAATWQNLGPDTVSGRIISFALHPTDSNTFYAGSASGGLWKSADHGVSWAPVTDAYPTMGIGAVAVNPQNPSSIIIATGEGYGFGGEFTSGFGILISYDAGITWSLTSVTASAGTGFAGMDIAWHPADTNRVCVATSYGVYFSADGGQTYSYVLDRMPSRMLAHPKAPDTLYLTARYFNAQYPGGFYKSYDAGQNWTAVTNAGLPVPADMGYASMAVHPVHGHIIYLNISKSIINGQGPMQGLYRSSDYGNTFSSIPTNVDIHCYHPPYTNICLGWYANTLALAPGDTNTLIAGGTRMWKSTDGGFNWATCDLLPGGSGYAVHPDHHQTFFNPVTGALFDCNDGGVNYSYDLGDTWTQISDGLVTHQFYNISFAETDPEVVIGGTQDVGLFSSKQSLSGGNWTQEYNGDAFGTAIDHTNEDIWYGSIYINYQRVKTISGGNPWFQINSGAPGDQWRMPMTMHPANPAILLSADGNYIYKTVSGGFGWQATAAAGPIGSFAFDKVQPDLVYASRLFGDALFRSLDGGDQWMQLPDAPGSPVTDLATDPLNAGTVYLTCGSYASFDQVYRSLDSGLTWTNISALLPAVAANTIAIDPRDNNILYVGTDLGVWVSENSGISWYAYNTGLPYTVVEDLHFYLPDTTIRIGTYGRGYWRTEAVPPTVTSAPMTGGTVAGFSAWPNPSPAGGTTTVRFNSSMRQSARMIVYDLAGRVVSERNISMKPGTNHMQLSVPRRAGIYRLQLSGPGLHQNIALVVTGR